MGLFSWITADTDESIPCTGACREHFTVYLLQPKGLPTLKETDYEGYGVFGGRDVYALFAEWNGVEGLTGNDDIDRGAGIDLYFHGSYDFPIKLVRDGELKYNAVGESETCPDQGYFYDDEIIECDNCHEEVSYHGELCYSCEMEMDED
jgi:hypothetical protein